MKAAMRDRYGPPEVVEIREVERPQPTGDELLVRVRAASVNRADLDGLYPRWGFIRLFSGLRRPRERRLGLDVAGVVEQVGSGVSNFKPGDRVFADLFEYGAGAFAQYACAPEKAFAHVPPNVSFEEAATLPHSAVLALQGLRLRSGRTPRPGQRVLVNGASGNVGPFAVQIAKSLGAEVTGVSSGEKVDFVRSLGADSVIDYRAVDYRATRERYDWIVDVDARCSLLRCRRSLRRGGAYVAMGGSTSWLLLALLLALPMRLLQMLDGRSAGLMLWWKPFNPPDVEKVKQLMAEGKLRSAIDRTFALEEIVEALRYVDEGRARGKVVITVSSA